MKHDKDSEVYLPTEKQLEILKDSEHYIPTMPGWNSDQPTDPERVKAAREKLRQGFDDSRIYNVTYTEISPPGVNDKWIFDTSKLSPEEKEALGKPGPGVIVFNDRLPSGEPCREDEVAGLPPFDLGRKDPIRKPAVFHDRLYDGIIAGTSDITQDQADKLFFRAMLAEADHHQLGYARSIFRYGIVRLVSFFRRVG